MFFLDSTIVLVIPALLLALWAQVKVKSTYAKYSRVPVRSGLTGADVAMRVLRDANITLVEDPEAFDGKERVCGLAATQGHLTDHYNPSTRTLNLSHDVFLGRNVAALGIAAHEVGHAIQHADNYAPLTLRGVIYPVCNLGSNLAFPLFFIGIFAHIPALMTAAIWLFSAAVAFTVLTLPVEFNASSRALKCLAQGGYLDDEELRGARKVLSAAALTYVAAALMAVLQLVRMLLISRD